MVSQSFIRHGQSFARNSRFQRTFGGSARTDHGFHLEVFGITSFGLRASSKVGPTRQERRPDERGDLRRASSRADHHAVSIPAPTSPTHRSSTKQRPAS